MMSIFLTSIRHFKNTEASYNELINKLYFLLNGYGITHIQKNTNEDTETQMILYFAMFFDRIDLLFGRKINTEYNKVKDIVNIYINSLLYFSGGLKDLETRLSEKAATDAVKKLEIFCAKLANTLSI